MIIVTKFNIGETVFFNDNYGKFRKSHLDIRSEKITGFQYRDETLKFGFGDVTHDNEFESLFNAKFCFGSKEECIDDFNENQEIW